MKLHAGRTLAVLLLAAGLMAVFGLAPATAGSQAHPEITDPAGDQSVAGAAPAAAIATAVDIVSAWVDNDTATAIQFHILLTGDPSGSLAGPASFEYHFHVTVGTTSYDASASADPTGAYTADGTVANAVAVANNVVTLSVAKSALGNPAKGTTLSAMYAEAMAANLGAPAGSLVSDTAPDAGATGAVTYTVTNGAAGNTTTSPSPTNSTSAHPTTTSAPPTSSTGPSPTTSTPATTTTAPTSTSARPSTSTTAPLSTGASSSSCDASNDLGGCFTGDNLGYVVFAVILFFVLLAVALIALLGRWAV